MSLQLSYVYQEWPLRKVFRISRETQVRCPVFVVHVTDGQFVGRGEGGELRQYGESREGTMAILDEMARRINECSTPELLNAAFPAGSARNAVDCALWDLACKRAGKSIWDLTGVQHKAELPIDFTIGIDNAEEMCRFATELAQKGYKELKIKVNAEAVVDIVTKIGNVAPGLGLIVDANEAWGIDQLKEVTPALTRLNVLMIEQPLHRKDDHQLEGYRSPIPLYADESFATSADLDRLFQRYDGVNIKMDKCGGLTEALKIVAGTRERNMGVMIGCAGGTSLGLAPAYVVGTMCKFRDLDSAGMMYEDRVNGMRYENGNIVCFEPKLWG